MATALAAEPALASIVVSQTFPGERSEYGDAMESVLREVANFAEPGAGPRPLTIPDERKDPDRLLEAIGVFIDLGSASAPPSTTLSTPSGGGGIAILSAVTHLEPPSLETSLPCDPAIILTAGPPLELLRPE